MSLSQLVVRIIGISIAIRQTKQMEGDQKVFTRFPSKVIYGRIARIYLGSWNIDFAIDFLAALLFRSLYLAISGSYLGQLSQA